MAKKLTFDEVISFIKENSDCIPLFNSFDKTTDKIKIQCGCGKEFTTTFNKFKTRNKRQCNDCGKKIFHEKTSLNIEYIKIFVKENSNCELISDYVYDSKEILKFKCKCGKEFNTSFNLFNSGNKRQCADCGNTLLKEQFKINIEEVNKYINDNGCKLLSTDIQYSNDMINIECSCGNIFKNTFTQLKGKRIFCCCKECAEKYRAIRRLTNLSKIKNRIGNDFELVSDFEGVHKPIYIKHRQCGQTFETTVSNFERNEKRCLCCDRTFKGEQKIVNYLNSNDIKFSMQQKYKNLRGVNNGLLSYDFYILDYNILVEYQGQYHDGTVGNQTEEQFKIQQEHDKRKKEYAELHNIELLEIWYWDYNNIEKILNNKINNNEVERNG